MLENEARPSELVVAAEGKTEAVVVVSPEAGLPESKGQDGNAVRGLDAGGKRNHEWLAAADLVKYIEMMTGAKPRLAATRAKIDAAVKGQSPVVLVGEEALRAKPDLAQRIRAAAKPEPEATLYTVKPGDSLSKIAKAHYGDPMKYPVIFEANKPMLTDPDKIYPGQVLRISPLDE